MDMASLRRSTSIRSPSSPNEPGLFGRLLRRTKSPREKREPPKDLTSGYQQQPSEQPALTRQSGPPNSTFVSPTATATMGSAAVLLQPPQPTIRKKKSIRDRFRALARDGPTVQEKVPEKVPEKKARVVYVPTHAASDFSRLVVAPGARPPSRQQQRYSSDSEPRTTTAVQWTKPGQSSEDELHQDRRPYSPGGLQTLAEDEPIPGHQQHSNLDQSTESTRNPEPESTPTQQANTRPSDFELFRTRAEQEDRAYRERLISTPTQRQYPPAGPETCYPPHATDSAVVTDPSTPRKQPWEGRASGLDSGIGSKSSSSHQELLGRSNSTRHRRRTSWALSGQEGDGLEVVGEERYTTQGRGLKKQVSVRKKLGEYIKPGKVAV